MSVINNDLNNLLASINIPIAMLDKDLRIRRFTPGAESILNVIPSDIGRHIFNIKTNIILSDLEKLLFEVIHTGEMYQLEIQDKKTRWYLMRILPYQISNGEIDGVVITFTDIQNIKQSEQHLRYISDASTILSSSLEYKTTHSNVARISVPEIADWCTISMKTENGIEQLAVMHKDPEKIKWAEELNKKRPTDPNEKTGVPNVLRTGKSEFYPEITDAMLVAAAKNTQELDLMRKIGFTSAMIVPFVVRDTVIGAITFVSAESQRQYTKSDLLMAEEVAGRAALAIENSRLYTQMQKAVRLRDEFISVASHELNTPITSLKMYTQVMQRQLKRHSTDVSIDSLLKMDTQINKLSLLIGDLLNISKLQHGKLEFVMEALDINELILETVEAIQATEKKHTIVIQGKIKRKIYADRYRMYQVITNLLTNAIKYSPSSEKIIISVEAEKNTTIIRVQDFGIGIELDQQKNIFDQFYRVNSPKEKTYPGLGMGLYIAREIVKRHGGEIHVTSEKGNGSIFTIILPYEPIHTDQ